MATIVRSMIVKKLNENPNQIFAMVYVKKNGELRKATCRLHVSNPKHTLVPGTGLYAGESAADALKIHNNLKYFDLGVDGKPRAGQTEGKGDFRTAKIDSIKELTINGVHYDVI